MYVYVFNCKGHTNVSYGDWYVRRNELRTREFVMILCVNAHDALLSDEKTQSSVGYLIFMILYERMSDAPKLCVRPYIEDSCMYYIYFYIYTLIYSRLKRAILVRVRD